MKYQMIKTEDGEDSHIPDTSGNYASLCGMDGEDLDMSVQQSLSGKSDVVTCEDCIRIWDVVMSIPSGDLVR